MDRLGHHLYLVVLALGFAYLIPGVATRHQGWTASGARLVCLGVAIILTDVAPVVVTGIEPLVFAAIAVAATLVRGLSASSASRRRSDRRPGPVAGTAFEDRALAR